MDQLPEMQLATLNDVRGAFPRTHVLHCENVRPRTALLTTGYGTTRYQALWPLLGSSSLQVRDPEGN